MSRNFTLAIFCLLSMFAKAQINDTTVYKIVENMPRFPGCEYLSDDLKARNDCASQKMVEFIYRNIRYPEEARLQNIQGTVVVSFIIEPDGTVSNVLAVKDIGGGCGAEALRLINAMNDAGVRWIPGNKAGVPVRVQMNLPVKFRLEDPKDYVMIGRDSVYTVLDTVPVFKGGEAALQSYLKTNITYPEAWKDSCAFGHIDLTLLIRPNGETYVLDIANYNNLGFDFVWEAIYESHKMWKLWEPAQYKGRPVGATADFRITFKPQGASCQSRWQKFEAAEILANDGIALFNEGKQEEGLKKLHDAVNQFPENAQFRYMRGQALVQMQRLKEACEDYSYVRQVLNIAEVNQLAIILCGSAD